MHSLHTSEFHFTEKTCPKSKFHSSRQRPCEKKVAIVVENGLMGGGMDWRYNLEKNLLFQSELFHGFHRGEIDFPEYNQCEHFQLLSDKLIWSTTSNQCKNPSQPWHCSAFQNLLWHPCLMLILRNWKVIVALGLINYDSSFTFFYQQYNNWWPARGSCQCRHPWDSFSGS